MRILEAQRAASAALGNRQVLVTPAVADPQNGGYAFYILDSEDVFVKVTQRYPHCSTHYPVVIEARSNIHLADHIRAICSGGSGEIMLKDGDREDNPLLCIDRYDRVWFDAAKKNPDKDETVLCELENGEMLWCIHDGENYMTDPEMSVIGGTSHKVDVLKWARTYE